MHLRYDLSIPVDIAMNKPSMQVCGREIIKMILR
jgi:hypothetical protein